MRRRAFAERIVLSRGGTQASFFPCGALFAIEHDGVLINGFRGSPSGGSVNQIYLRSRSDGAVLQTAPLLGVSPTVECADGAVRQSGSALGIEYGVTFHLADEWTWFWEVTLRGQGMFDLLYGQDIGMGDMGMVLTNELYAAQYLGHTVLKGPGGYAVCSRQNMPQSGGRNPYLQQGMLRGEAVAYSTDGTQFFGLSYKRDNTPRALHCDLPSENYQYEFSYTGLQSRPVRLDGEATLVFYGLFRPDHPQAITSLEYAQALEEAAGVLTRPLRLASVPPMQRSAAIDRPYASPEMDDAQIAALWPDRHLEEYADGTLQSFFVPGDPTHVVLQAKELRSERPHGTILIGAPGTEQLRPNVLTSTNAMYGLFAAQTVVGNTTLHKAVSAARGILNVQKHPGVRLYMRLEGRYRLLTLPAAYAMGPGRAQWQYLLPGGDALRIDAFVSADEPCWTLQARSALGRQYDFLLTMQTVMGDQEWAQDVDCTQTGGILRLRPAAVPQGAPYPGLYFDMQLDASHGEWSGDGIFFADGIDRDETLLTVPIGPTDGFALMMRGALADAPPQPLHRPDIARETLALSSYMRRMMGDLVLSLGASGPATSIPDGHPLARVMAIAPWYVHNALIHFASPHGLEQPGGAAWGTRDVCQGPFELLATFGHFPLMRWLLLRVFAHQRHATGEWPQWFMFDGYPIAAGEAHGDVFLWPLKCVAEYLHATGDHSVLDEPLPYADHPQPQPLLSHIARAVDHLQARLLPDAALISYAGGDWDDTLQPVQPWMQQALVSSWTQALACQVAGALQEALAAVPTPETQRLAQTLEALAARMRDAFERYLILDGQIAGFVLRTDAGFEPLLHPLDTRTGLRCRLIPLTRSIIAGLVDGPQAARNLEQIDTYLSCPDSVRLMDHPVPYEGGVAKLFRRAEQAANVGREIGLAYVHAQIRAIEAYAKLGRAERAWQALLAITPPCITQSVQNAVTRQSNLYFTSSDGAFPDRYAFARDYDRLRTGDVPVKGGWRLYSSGPGIYLHTFIGCILGIRPRAGGFVIDPVLPATLDGLRVAITLEGRSVVFHFNRAPGAVRVDLTLEDPEQETEAHASAEREPLPGRRLADNRYRDSGLYIRWEEIEEHRGAGNTGATESTGTAPIHLRVTGGATDE